MNAVIPSSRCPDAAALRAFLLALSPESDSEALAQHLLECPSCCRLARSVQADDSFVAAVCQAPTTAVEGPDGRVVQELIDRLRRPPSSGRTAAVTPPPDGASRATPQANDFL